MKKAEKTLGILGGMGPLASAHFLGLILSHTLARRDGDFIDIVMTGRSSTPDRTAHILGMTAENPLDTMKKDIDILIYGGADIIAVPCNTAMAYYEMLSSYSKAPVMNIVALTARRAAEIGARTVMVFATYGTKASGIYPKECEKYGVRCLFPDDTAQSAINGIIYQKIKAGACVVNEIYPLFDLFLSVSDAVILGCTELSLINIEKYDKKKYIIDSSLVLAEHAIAACGGTPVGFEW